MLKNAHFVLLVFVASSWNNVMSELEEESELHITVDNAMEIFIDGVAQPINDQPSAKDWRLVKTVPVPQGAQVLAIMASDLGLWAGLLASLDDDSLVSDDSWKVSTDEVDGWMNSDFDDSDWELATEQGENGMSPWKFMDGISPNAKWIWTETSYYNDINEHVVYFRVHF